METRIEMGEPELGVVRGDNMKAGDFGVIIAVNTNTNCLDHYVYRHTDDGRVLDLSDVPTSWERPTALSVRLLPLSESITITRTE